ncbi:MAG: hypothetical protein U5N58_11650 [Actinomycetota bacterium]|nr:hypothetical protein [Actinomycetota bacterium]
MRIPPNSEAQSGEAQGDPNSSEEAEVPENNIDLEIESSAASVSIGEEVTFGYTITNSGDAALEGLTLNVDTGSIGLSKNTLEPGESITASS